MSGMRHVDNVVLSAEKVEPPVLGTDTVVLETKNAPLKVTILRKLESLDIRTCFSNIQTPIILSLLTSAVLRLSGLNGSCFLVLYEQLGKKKEGVLFNIRSNYYGIVDYIILKQISIDSEQGSFEVHSMEQYNSMFTSSLIPAPKLVEVPNLEELRKSFSMKRPKTELKQLTLPVKSPQHIDNPLHYLKSRYYSILYSNSTPLSYFPKTAISRMKVLSNRENDRIKEVLEAIILPTEELDRRHSGKLGILHFLHSDTASQLDEQFEIPTQTEFISKQDGMQDDTDIAREKVSKLALRLKIREAQLQLILILELLCAREIEEAKFLLQTAQDDKPKKQRPSLVRKKKSTKKIIPTFLGMGVASVDVETKSSSHKLDDFTTLQTINNVVEKMDIWDTLYDRNSDGLMTYVAYVLVPYFNRKLPLTIKYIVEKIKSLSMKTKSLSSRKSISRSKSYSAGQLDSKMRRKSSSTSSDTVKTIDVDTFGPPISLRRSKSNISSKNLHKRQVDLSNPAADKQQEEKPQDSFIFAKAKRIRSAQNVKPPDMSKSQVAATPVKPKPKRTQVFIAQTPVRKAQVSDALANSVIVSPEAKIISPLEKIVKPNPNVFETPLPIFSSPVISTERRKPGDPVTFAHSPFFNALNGSPTANYVPATTEKEEPGIFTRVPTKRKRP